MLVSSDEENRLGIEAYEKSCKRRRCRTTLSSMPWCNVSGRVLSPVNRPDFAWEFHVIDKDTANAFALPGEKSLSTRAFSNRPQTETGLAVVLGHEVAHALACHGGERMSRSMIAQLDARQYKLGSTRIIRPLCRGLLWLHGAGVNSF